MEYKNVKFKLGKREITIWKGWFPIFLILILPEALINFAPWPEDFSRLIMSLGIVIGGTLLFIWLVIVLNPKPMTDLQKRNITEEKYKKAIAFATNSSSDISYLSHIQHLAYNYSFFIKCISLRRIWNG
jgi:hypothetical protein